MHKPSPHSEKCADLGAHRAFSYDLLVDEELRLSERLRRTALTSPA
jgi:hypothetical protein